MRIRLRGWRAWLVVAAAGVAVAYVAWATREVPVPEIPRPGPSAFTEREVQMDVSGAARRVELEPRSAAAWGEYGIVLRAYRQHPEADRCFQVAADLDPADGRWPYLIGTHLADADPVAAVGWLERAARGTVPAAARETVRARLAETLIAAGRPADALAALGPDPATNSGPLAPRADSARGASGPLAGPRIRLAAARAAAAAGDDRAAAEYLGDLDDHAPA